MNTHELVVDNTHYFMDRVSDMNGEHYIKENITTVLNLQAPLQITYKNITSVIHPDLLQIRQDNNGNDMIIVPLRQHIHFFVRGLFLIDAIFTKHLEGTYLHNLVQDKQGCYAISGFEVIEAPLAFPYVITSLFGGVSTDGPPPWTSVGGEPPVAGSGS
jgi:hypothetical protein